MFILVRMLRMLDDRLLIGVANNRIANTMKDVVYATKKGKAYSILVRIKKLFFKRV